MSLAGKNKDSVNKVIIHYSIKDSIVSMIELRVFSAPQIKAIEAALDQKLGKASYPSDAYTTVFSENVRFYNRIWVDPKSTVGHFLHQRIKHIERARSETGYTQLF